MKTRERTLLAVPGRLGIVLLLLVAALGLMPVPAAQAATYAVDRTDDNAAATACTAAANDCSLRGAITAANTNPGLDTITLPSGTYTLTLGAAGEDNNATGDLDILAAGGDLTINGAGAGTTIIDGNANDRVFHIDPGAAGGITVNISGLTIRHGNVSGGDPDGGGIHNSGTLNITGCTISNNDSGHEGGGLFNANGGDATLTNCTVSGNNTAGYGGGISNYDTLRLINSTVSGNTAGSSGGIDNYLGTVTLTNSTVSDNEATNDGGGIGNWGGMTLTNCTVSGNQAGTYGGGIGNWVGMTLTNSTVSGNQADGGGGGIYSGDGTANLSNVTISDNTADEDGNGDGDGGGIYHNGGTVNLKNTILAGNTDNSPGAEAPDCSSAAGGIVTFGDNIVQNQTPCNLGGGGTNDDVDPVLGSLADNGGDTQTHALLGGSPAIDAVTDCTDLGGDPVATDQRGVARPRALPATSGRMKTRLRPRLSPSAATRNRRACWRCAGRGWRWPQRLVWGPSA